MVINATDMMDMYHNTGAKFKCSLKKCTLEQPAFQSAEYFRRN